MANNSQLQVIVILLLVSTLSESLWHMLPSSFIILTSDCPVMSPNNGDSALMLASSALPSGYLLKTNILHITPTVESQVKCYVSIIGRNNSL
jgi:hypothetical protein